MFVDSSTVKGRNGKTYSRALLRSSYRENGKVKHRTLGNLSSCSPEEIQAVRLALLEAHQTSIEAFPGNTGDTGDTRTVANQIAKLQQHSRRALHPAVQPRAPN